MIDDETEGRAKLALKLTWISAISFLIGGTWAWFIVRQGGPEALGAVIPMFAVGAIHILLGPMAILHAFRSCQFARKKYIYLYFSAYFVVTIVILKREAIIYSVIFFLAVITPLLFSIVRSLIRGAK